MNFQNMVEVLSQEGVLYKCNNTNDIYDKALAMLEKKDTNFANKAADVVKSLTGATEIILTYIYKRIGQ